jgi:hypothetical protein
MDKGKKGKLLTPASTGSSKIGKPKDSDKPPKMKDKGWTDGKKRR